MSLPDDIAEAVAGAAARLGPFAREIRWYPEVTSTSDLAATWAEHGAAEGAVVIADAQSAGRGRYGRSWASPPGAGLYLSTVLKPAAAMLPLLTIAAGVAVAEGIERAAGLRTSLKWPNDVLVGDRKLAGLLAEVVAANTAILGIGINVMPGSYPADVAARATSLEAELGRAIDRGLLFVEVLASFASHYEGLKGVPAGALLDSWRRRAAATLGREVTWMVAGRQLRGVAENIDDRGALLVRTPAGIERIISGEVTWVRA